MGCQFADEIFDTIFMNKTLRNLFSQNCIPNDPIDIESSLAQLIILGR